MVGMIMAGVSVSILFAIVTRLVDTRNDSRRLDRRECLIALEDKDQMAFGAIENYGVIGNMQFGLLLMLVRRWLDFERP
jgi:hypothetical protein